MSYSDKIDTPFRMHCEFKPAGDQPQAIEKLVEGLEDLPQLLGQDADTGVADYEADADLVGAQVHELSLNGSPLDPAEVYADHRLRLSDLQAENELRVVADMRYSHTGEGLHRFVDPADDRVYLYSQFEVPDARRVFTTFEQPDLKSVFTFTVTAPSGWKVVSNASAASVEDGVHRFAITDADGNADVELNFSFPLTRKRHLLLEHLLEEFADTLPSIGGHQPVPFTLLEF